MQSALIKMRPVPIPRILRRNSRPQCSCMQCQFHAIMKQVVVATVFYVVEPSMVNYLPYYFFYSTPNPVKNVVVPALEGQAAFGAVARGASRQLAMKNPAQFMLAILHHAVIASMVCWVT